jgi:uncharacterized protein YebE (UPF0316 family)
MIPLTMLQSALLIFALRLGDVTLAILRILMVMRGRKALAWVFGFFQALVFVIAIRQVFNDLNNWMNIIGYAMGFATGTVVGVWLEERLALGYGHMRIISSRQGANLVECLRQEGYAVTQIAGRGRDGTVDVLNCSVPRRQVDAVKSLVTQLDPHAFVTVEHVQPLHRGFWRKQRANR